MNAEQFLKCVAKHKMKIVKDDGVFRHLVFSRPNDGAYCFHLTTFPEHLVITGDCGSYVFRRLYDMFEFFRTKELKINEWYWSEKLEAVDRSAKVRMFSPETIKEKLTRDFESYIEDFDDEQKTEAWKDFKEKILNFCESEYDFKSLWTVILDCGYECEVWDYDPYVFGDGFLFSLYAIVWGIMQYDKTKTN